MVVKWKDKSMELINIYEELDLAKKKACMSNIQGVSCMLQRGFIWLWVLF